MKLPNQSRPVLRAGMRQRLKAMEIRKFRPLSYDESDTEVADTDDLTDNGDMESGEDWQEGADDNELSDYQQDVSVGGDDSGYDGGENS